MLGRVYCVLIDDVAKCSLDGIKGRCMSYDFVQIVNSFFYDILLFVVSKLDSKDLSLLPLAMNFEYFRLLKMAGHRSILSAPRKWSDNSSP